jgi:hypothetical protein
MRSSRFVPMVFVYPLVEDRKINTRHQLRVMGMDMRAYWLSAFVADYLLSAFVGLALVAVIGGFGIGAQQCAPPGFGWARPRNAAAPRALYVALPRGGYAVRCSQPIATAASARKYGMS